MPSNCKTSHQSLISNHYLLRCKETGKFGNLNIEYRLTPATRRSVAPNTSTGGARSLHGPLFAAGNRVTCLVPAVYSIRLSFIAKHAKFSAAPGGGAGENAIFPGVVMQFERLVVVGGEWNVDGHDVVLCRIDAAGNGQ